MYFGICLGEIHVRSIDPSHKRDESRCREVSGWKLGVETYFLVWLLVINCEVRISTISAKSSCWLVYIRYSQ